MNFNGAFDQKQVHYDPIGNDRKSAYQTTNTDFFGEEINISNYQP